MASRKHTVSEGYARILPSITEKRTGVTNDFLDALNRTFLNLAGYSTSWVLFHAIISGLFLHLTKPRSVAWLCRQLNADSAVLEATLNFLLRAGYVQQNSRYRRTNYTLTELGRHTLHQRGWIELIVGGYAPAFGRLDELLMGGPDANARQMALIAQGSANIGRFDSIPLTLKLIASTCPQCRRLVDLGCGNANYLATYSRHFPSAKIEGCEPHPDSFAQAQRELRNHGLENRVQVVRCSAQGFRISKQTDVIVLAFVLHEMVGIDGRAAVIAFLKHLGQSAPSATIIVVEVDKGLAESVLKRPIEIGYYNAYHFLHVLTSQQLLPTAQWIEIFRKAGLKIIARAKPSKSIDPSGLEVGFALRRKEARVTNKSGLPKG